VSYAVNICCVTIDVKPGQSYYIKMEMQSDLQTKLVIVNPEVAEKEISGCRRYKGLLTPN
jgi:predicted CoA-binding protein